MAGNVKYYPANANAFNIWEPLEMQKDIWEQGEIDRNRVVVIKRAECTKTRLLMLWDSHTAGTAYIGIHNEIAMLHALQILPSQRRKCVGAIAIRNAAM